MIGAVALAGIVTALSADSSPTAATHGQGFEARSIEIVRSPLLPKKTRHIIKFHRWGLA